MTTKVIRTGSGMPAPRALRLWRAALSSAVATLTLLVFSLVAAARALAADPLQLGIQANSVAYGANSGFIQDKVVAAGGKWIREDFNWNQIQPTSTTWNWIPYDVMMENAARRGLRVLPALVRTPGWAVPQWWKNSYPSLRADWYLPEPGGYAGFVARATERYGPGGTFWKSRPSLNQSLAPTYFELWNEPYFTYFSTNGIDPAKYAKLVAAAAFAGRMYNPKTKFLMAATYLNIGGTAWVDAMYRAVPNLNLAFDAVAVHAYGDRPSAVALGDAGGSFRLTLETIRQQFVNHGAATKPFWATEFGWSTCSGGNSECVSETRQAQLISEAIAQFRSGAYSGYLRNAFLFSMTDNPNYNPNDRAGNYGLLRWDYERNTANQKPAWYVFRALTGS